MQDNYNDFLNKIALRGDQMILSVSGWRMLFGINANSTDSRLDPVCEALAAIVALSAAEFFEPVLTSGRPLLLGRDSRPTGGAISRIALAIFAAAGLPVDDCGIIAIPQLISYNADSDEHGGFFYISASHNPIGYNGFKMGYGKQGVMAAACAEPLISRFKKNYRDPGQIEKALKWLKQGRLQINDRNKQQTVGNQNRQLAAIGYRHAVLGNLCGSFKSTAIDHFVDRMAAVNRQRFADGMGIVIDFNGSARAVSIDRQLLADCGFSVRAINAAPGRIAGGILPEGENLAACRRALQQAYQKNSAFILGYMADNDGDRGNLVYINRHGQAEIVRAQEVFALLTLCRLLAADKNTKTVIAANAPTSLMVDRIADRFGATVARCEVGEANVINLARRLNENGQAVAALGEGSNGGSIIGNGKSRDPLITLMTITRTLLLHSEPPPNSRSGCSPFADLLTQLPQFSYNDSDDARAKIELTGTDFSALYRNYPGLFARAWTERLQTMLAPIGVLSYRVEHYRQTECFQTWPDSGQPEQLRGGLKALFLNARQLAVASVWFRPSGTEPLLRIMAEVVGDNPQLLDQLLQIQRHLVCQAAE